MIRLPWPPSVNRYWRHARGRTYTSAEGKAYRKAVADVYDGPVLDGPIRLTISAFPPDRRRRDLDNILKALLDALEGSAYLDDSQVCEILARKYEASPPGAVLVEVSKAS